MPQFVVAYDISDDRRRERVARVLNKYGQRIQKSVFVAQLERSDHQALRREMGSILRRCDTVEIIPIDSRLGDLHVSWNAEPSRVQSVVMIT